MEKLLNLLKQYWKRTFNDETLLRIYYEENTDCFCWMYQPRPGMKLEQGQILETPVVFSKRFGFVEWLCSNDKIDFESENYPLKKYYPYFNDDVLAIVSQDCNTYEDRCRVCYDKYEALLMLLAIQDKPIEFLISILK